MAFARDSYTATGGQTDFTITFPYLAEVDVLMFVNGTQLGQDADADTSSFQIVSGVTCRVGAGLTANDVVIIRRSSSQAARLVDYANASTLTENDLDDDSLQAFYMAQEAIDTAATALGLGSNDIWDATSLRIENVTDPTAAQDAATKNYVDTVLTAGGNVPVPAAAEYLLVSTGATAGDYAWQVSLDDPAMIANDLIDSQHIAAGALDAEHYAINSIDGTKIAIGSDASGDILYYNGTDWVVLVKGSDTEVLTLASGLPSWAAASGGITRTLSTDTATTSGTTSDLTDPGTAFRITCMFEGVSWDGTQELMLQLGDAGGIETTGYGGNVTNTNNGIASQLNSAVTGFRLMTSAVAAGTYDGCCTLTLKDATNNTWVISGSMHRNDSAASCVDLYGGAKSLSGVLTTVRLTTHGTPDDFDAGSWSILWEEST